ncbi:uncharacterized protein LOC136086713 [Hydra vulgaris]|uniref:Uncharacterized protein LOC136086713 n=1 Tax=Hydra vulgaris TaxID=6087 RepID=A0ABM4CT49_HYDVU
MLRYGIFLREINDKNVRNYTVDHLVTDMLPALLGQWLKASTLFTYPVIIHEKTIFKKLKCLWKPAVDFSIGRGKKAEKERFSLKFDNLVDILFCKCKLILCTEYKCDSKCMEKIHIKCKCKRDEKIPVLELQFIHYQRTKIGSFETFHIGGADRKESKRIEIKQQKQRTIEVNKEDKPDETFNQIEQIDCMHKNESLSLLLPHIEQDYEYSENVQGIYINSCSSSFKDGSGQKTIQSDNQTQCKFSLNHVLNLKTCSIYNTMSIENIALASMRHHTSLRETAEIATATLIDAKIISKSDCHLIIDHNKVKRAQEKFAKKLNNQFEVDLEKNPVSCLFFDGRVDATKMFIEVNKRSFPSLIKEEHYSFVKDPGGDYLFHFVSDMTNNKKKAEVIADHIVDWLNRKNQNQNLMAIRGDSTNVNTGWAGGVMQWVEKKLNRRLV